MLGLALFVISSAMLRASSRAAADASGNSAAVTWPRLVDDDLAAADTAMRLDMIERLGLVPGDWSREILERAREEETDANVTAAIDKALSQG